jgi:hypothetical protein
MATKSEHIEQLLQQIQSTIATEDPDQKLQGLFDDLKAAMADYEAEAPTDESIVENDINYALNDQNLTISQREKLLKTKLRQIELAQERNESKKGMLIGMIIINIVVLLIFISLIVLKATGR